MNGTVMSIFPHPDDETFISAGVMAAAVARGIPVTVISATRGEAGESSIAGLDGPDDLGAIRERELRDAMQQLGVSDVRFLDYRDSGMEGSAEAAHPRAFVQASIDEVAAKLVTLIRAIRPGIILTFGPEGVYGHPDHLHIHEATTRAVVAAADPAVKDDADAEPWETPALYFGTAPREQMLAMRERPNSPLASISERALANLGVPRDEITHIIDTRAWTSQKRAAFAAHTSQSGEGGPLDQNSTGDLEQWIGWEHFVRASLPWAADSASTDLLDQLLAEQSAS